ncbi:hypothetical protein T492DRAFT_284755 [Pavlovales sp. CCMP2436]|nr:hypothetical protein T492DRAFT_284755 [Pavlovales sp. CCMP2436]
MVSLGVCVWFVSGLGMVDHGCSLVRMWSRLCVPGCRWVGGLEWGGHGHVGENVVRGPAVVDCSTGPGAIASVISVRAALWDHDFCIY